MGIIRLTLLTVAAVGGAMVYFGRDEGVEDVSLGRDTLLFSDLLSKSQDTAASKPVADEVLLDALKADASPETSSNVSFEDQAEIKPAEPEAPPVLASVEPESEPEPEVAMLYVTGSRVNVRGGPSTDYGVIASLTRGTPVGDLGDAGEGWRIIRLMETGERGYMAGRFLTEDQQ